MWEKTVSDRQPSCMTIDAVLLAAGNSIRFGENKLLYELEGRPMYLHLLERITGLHDRQKIRRIVLVTQYQEIAEQAIERDLPVHIVENQQPEKGISHSIKLGLEALEQEEPEACMFAVCDQPYLTERTLLGLLRSFEVCGKGIAACGNGLEPGNPVIFGKKYFEELKMLQGDIGGKKILKRHREDVFLYQTRKRELEDLDVKISDL